MAVNELASVMDAHQLPALASNEDGYYVYANEATRRFLGYEVSEVVGWHLKDLVADNPRMIMAALEDLNRQGYVSAHVRYRHADGGIREADVNIFRQILAQGTRVNVSLIHPRAGVGAYSPRPEASVDPGLTYEDVRLLHLLADGFSNDQVARVIDDSEDAIVRQVQVLLTKMNAKSRTEAVVLAFKKRVIL